MEIRSILVAADLAPVGAPALAYAVALAGRHKARLIGIAAGEPNLALAGADSGIAAMEYYETERAQIDARFKAIAEQFRAAVPAGIESEWTTIEANPTRAVVDAARRADLVVVAGSDEPAPAPIDLGELILAAGRPILAVSDESTVTRPGKVIIAWKDTREGRRAVSDALPLLREATEIAAITVSEGGRDREQENLDDLIAWLARHGITATGELLVNSEGFIDTLESTARVRGADLVVAGGYGHSRMREWLFGGMTRNLIRASSLNRFFSS